MSQPRFKFSHSFCIICALSHVILHLQYKNDLDIYLYTIMVGMLLLLLLSRFSHVKLCATPSMEAHQAPPSQGFSKQEHWSGLPCPSPVHESEREVAQLCLTLCDPMHCSLPGSSVHGFSMQEYWSRVPLPSPGLKV